MPFICSRRFAVGVALAVFVGLAPVAVPAAGVLTLQKQAPFAKDLAVPEAVRKEGDLENKIPDYVRVNAEGNFDKVALVDSASAGTPGKALAMKITGLMGKGGGAWSGPKQISIEGTLWDSGKIVGTFQAMRFSGGGAFGSYKGTCAILDTCAKEIGQDVSKWLTEPSMNARLGDAH